MTETVPILVAMGWFAFAFVLNTGVWYAATRWPKFGRAWRVVVVVAFVLLLVMLTLAALGPAADGPGTVERKMFASDWVNFLVMVVGANVGSIYGIRLGERRKQFLSESMEARS